MHAVYKYVYNGEIIYIGKTDSSLSARVYCHSHDSRFKPYKDSEIYYFETDNKYSTMIWEKMMIHKYRPKLNVADNYYEYEVDEEEPTWLIFDENVEIKHDRVMNVWMELSEKEYVKLQNYAESEHITSTQLIRKWIRLFIPEKF